MDDFNFKKIANIDISSLDSILSSITPEDWEIFTFRQLNYRVHRSTQTIPIISKYFDPNTFDNKWGPLFKNFLVQLKNIINNGSIHNCLLVKLKSHSNIKPHKDHGNFHTRCRRFHIPLVTNPNVLFTVGGETIHMLPGEIWEINNSGKVHSVCNNGTEDRLHLIIDVD